MPTQLPLELPLSPNLSFESFHPGPNAEGVQQLRESVRDADGGAIHVWGPAGVGKTHLLQALCNEIGGTGRAVTYLPMDLIVRQMEPAAFDGLEGLHLVCIDRLGEVVGNAAWESALASLLDRIRESGAAVVLASRLAPGELDCATTALDFRLGLMLRLALRPLDPGEEIWAMQLKARARGAKLPADVARYLLRHYSDDMSVLSRLIETLDYAALASKRQITKPFIRSVLARQKTRR